MSMRFLNYPNPPSPDFSSPIRGQLIVSSARASARVTWARTTGGRIPKAIRNVIHVKRPCDVTWRGPKFLFRLAPHPADGRERLRGGFSKKKFHLTTFCSRSIYFRLSVVRLFARGKNNVALRTETQLASIQ